MDVGAAASLAPAAWRAERRALALAVGLRPGRRPGGARCGPPGRRAAGCGLARPIGSGTADRARYSSAGMASAAPPNRVAATSPAMISAAPIAFHRSIGSRSQIAAVPTAATGIRFE